MKLNRKITRIVNINDDLDEDYVQTTMTDRVGMVWDMTVQLWSVSTKGEISAESRLQRNIASLKKE